MLAAVLTLRVAVGVSWLIPRDPHPLRKAPAIGHAPYGRLFDRALQARERGRLAARERLALVNMANPRRRTGAHGTRGLRATRVRGEATINWGAPGAARCDRLSG